MIRSQLTYEFTHDHRIKLLVCGDSSVGKTSLLTRFVSDKFNLSQNRTVGKPRQIQSRFNRLALSCVIRPQIRRIYYNMI